MGVLIDRSVQLVSIVLPCCILISCSEPREFSIDENTITPWLHTLNPTVNRTYHSYLYIPEEYAEGSNEYPLLVHLHGWGNFGIETHLSQLAQGALKSLYNEAAGTLYDSGPGNLNSNVRRSFVLYPRLQKGAPGDIMGQWDSDALDLLIDYTMEHYRIDSDRLYITGLSYGGAGTWRYAIEKSERTAAILPICGYPSVDAINSGLRHIPVWLFYSFDDTVISGHTAGPCLAMSNLTGMDDVLEEYPHINGNWNNPADDDVTLSCDESGSGVWQSGVAYPTDRISFTIYQTGCHDAWTRTYANDTVWTWLFSQTKH